MGFISNAEIVARIAEISSRIYSTIVDKSRAKLDRENKIKELEKELAELKAKLK